MGKINLSYDFFSSKDHALTANKVKKSYAAEFASCHIIVCQQLSGYLKNKQKT
jgi:hypothetical protein